MPLARCVLGHRRKSQLQLQVPAGEQQPHCTPGWCRRPAACRHLPAVLPRRAGYCDDVYGMCWCDASSKFGWKGMANGTARPSARPLGDSCHPSTDKAGVALDWGAKRYDELYGAQGWCDADKPTWHGRWAAGTSAQVEPSHWALRTAVAW